MAYPGVKSGDGVYQAIINQLPPHDRYCEPFAGAAGIFRHKRAAASSILVDADRHAPAMAMGDRDVSTITIVGDGIAYLLSQRWTPADLIYCDPPYLRSSRKTAAPIYSHEMTDEQHVMLLAALKSVPCMVAISGYDNSLYRTALKDWRLVTFQAATRGGPALEHLWMNYPEPTVLHDYRYVGHDYRERERIKKKARRWAARFAELPPLERLGILSAMSAVRDLSTSMAVVLETGPPASSSGASWSCSTRELDGAAWDAVDGRQHGAAGTNSPTFSEQIGTSANIAPFARPGLTAPSRDFGAERGGVAPSPTSRRSKAQACLCAKRATMTMKGL